MKSSLIVLFVLIANFAYSQIANVNLNGVPLRVSGYAGVDGSPYLFEDWSKADVATKNGGIKENVSFRFNIHENELEAINDTGNTILLDKSYLDYFILERPASLLNQNEGLMTKLLFKNGFEGVKGINAKDFINVLAEGEHYTLVRKYYTDLVTPPKNSYAPTPGRMFIFEETFYLINEDKEVSSVKNRNNQILKSLLKEDQDLGKEIIKEGNLNLSREDHLIIFFQKLNERKK